MKTVSRTVVPVLLFAAMMMGGAMLWAQDRGERGDRGDRGPREERRQIDREEMRERMEQRRAEMAERMRERLGVSEEEWDALEPMIAEVRQLQAEQQMGGRGGFGPWARRGGDGGEGERERSPLQQAHRDLVQSLRGDEASDEEIQERLEALRAAREEHRERLEEAQAELREALTPRQEAQLVIVGVLE